MDSLLSDPFMLVTLKYISLIATYFDIFSLIGGAPEYCSVPLSLIKKVFLGTDTLEVNFNQNFLDL